MRVLCAIGARRGAEVVRQVAELARAGDELVLLHVIDSGPRQDVDRLRGPLHPHHEHAAELDVAEEDAARAALKEAAEEAARVRLPVVERVERGRPEHVIISVAAEISADLVVLCPRESPTAHPRQGPPSVGHTARFVVDHAPTRVLLLRDKGPLEPLPHHPRGPHPPPPPPHG
jgi:nucleotide-binding universal stress UspA family protein